MSTAAPTRRPRRTKAEMEQLRALGLEPPKRARPPKPAASSPRSSSVASHAALSTAVTTPNEESKTASGRKKIPEEVTAVTRPMIRHLKKMQEQLDAEKYNQVLDQMAQKMQRLKIKAPEESEAKEPKPLTKYQKYIQRCLKMPEMEEYKQTDKMIEANRLWKAYPNQFRDLN